MHSYENGYYYSAVVSNGGIIMRMLSTITTGSVAIGIFTDDGKGNVAWSRKTLIHKSNRTVLNVNVSDDLFW